MAKHRFQFGGKKPPNSGRKKGVPNKAHRDLRELLDKNLDDETLWKLWKKKLFSQNENVALKALELALHYRFGKPVQPLVGVEEAPPIKIDISAIPKFRIPVKPS